MRNTGYIGLTVVGFILLTVVGISAVASVSLLGANTSSTSTSAYSGMELISNQLTLLRGCSDGQILKYNDTTGAWDCNDDSTTAVTGAGTDDTVLVGNGATFDSKALPDCANTGDAVTYNTGSNAFGCNTFLFSHPGAITSPTTSSHSEVLKWPAATDETITEVTCAVDSGTMTIQLEERAESALYSSGTEILTSSLVCDSDSEDSSAFDNSFISAGNWIVLVLQSATGSQAALNIGITYRKGS